MSKPVITRFEPHGPADTGLVEWPQINPDGLVAGTPVQKGHIYHEEKTAGYLAGVWDCTPMTAKFGPYDVHEFMLLLEGSVTMILADGTEVKVNAGEAFIIPKGLPCQWKQDDYVRKFFVILEDPDTPAASDVGSQGVILPLPAGPADGLKKVEITDASGYVGELPKQSEHVYFKDPSKKLEIGIWESTPFESEVSPSPCSELMCVIEGSMILTDETGHEQQFGAGDSVYVPKGASCGWKSTEYVRKFYSIYTP